MKKRSNTLGLTRVVIGLFIVFFAGNLFPNASAFGAMLISRVSVDSAGNQGNGDSLVPSISRDGRFVAFESVATNLVPGDTNSQRDIFVHDLQTGLTTRVSVSSAGIQGDGDSFFPSISGDGRFVAFMSRATNLVPGDTNGRDDVFVHDRQTGLTTRVSVDSAGNQVDALSSGPSISGDGRFVALHNWPGALVPEEEGIGGWDVFVHDRQTGMTTRVSVSSTGIQGDSDSGNPSISGDGRSVAFESVATNLVPGDTNGALDVFCGKRVVAGGLVDGLSSTKVICRNLNTRQTLIIEGVNQDWDCEGAGLIINPGDSIDVIIKGTAE